MSKPQTRKIYIKTATYTVFEDGFCDTKEPLANVVYDLAYKLYHYYNINKKLIKELKELACTK